jgi:uncharacterized protein (TIGR02646 family)
MIRVARAKRPSILQKKAVEWTRSLLELKQQLLLANVATIPDLKKKYKIAELKYQHESIKNTLTGNEMFNGKCAYCESFILHIDYGHIEHYRPKSVYPALTFEWDNLLLACGICNGKQFKGDKFSMIADIPAFINPCEDDPCGHFNFVFDENLQKAFVYGTTNRGEITEKELGLNNRQDLLKYRSIHVHKLIHLAKYANEDPQAKELLDAACKPEQAFSAFAIAIRQKYTNQ